MGRKKQPSPLKQRFALVERGPHSGLSLLNSASSQRSIQTNNSEEDIQAMSSHRRKSIGERLNDMAASAGKEPFGSLEFWDKLYPRPISKEPTNFHEALYNELDHSQELRRFGNWPRALEAWRVLKTFMEKAIMRADIMNAPISMNDKVWIGDSPHEGFERAAAINAVIPEESPSHSEMGEYNVGMRDLYLEIVKEYKQWWPNCNYWTHSQHDIKPDKFAYPGYHSSYLLIYDDDREENWYAIFHLFEGFKGKKRWLRQTLAIGFAPEAWDRPQQPVSPLDEDSPLKLVKDKIQAFQRTSKSSKSSKSSTSEYQELQVRFESDSELSDQEERSPRLTRKRRYKPTSIEEPSDEELPVEEPLVKKGRRITRGTRGVGRPIKRLAK